MEEKESRRENEDENQIDGDSKPRSNIHKKMKWKHEKRDNVTTRRNTKIKNREKESEREKIKKKNFNRFNNNTIGWFHTE